MLWLRPDSPAWVTRILAWGKLAGFAPLSGFEVSCGPLWGTESNALGLASLQSRVPRPVKPKQALEGPKGNEPKGMGTFPKEIE